jgi:hypothetical protein
MLQLLLLPLQLPLQRQLEQHHGLCDACDVSYHPENSKSQILTFHGRVHLLM